MSSPEQHNVDKQAESERHVQALEAAGSIQKWCKEQFDKVLTITCVKDYGLVEPLG